MSNEYLTETPELSNAIQEFEAIAEKYNVTGCYTITHKNDKRITSKWFWHEEGMAIKLNSDEIGDFILNISEITQCAIKNIFRGIHRIDTIISIFSQKGHGFKIDKNILSYLDERWQKYADKTIDEMEDTLWGASIVESKPSGSLPIWLKLNQIWLSAWASRKMFDLSMAFWGNTLAESDIPKGSTIQDLIK